MEEDEWKASQVHNSAAISIPSLGLPWLNLYSNWGPLHHTGSAIRASHWEHSSTSRLLTRLFPCSCWMPLPAKDVVSPIRQGPLTEYPGASGDRLSHPSSHYSLQICSSKSQGPICQDPAHWLWWSFWSIMNLGPWVARARRKAQGRKGWVSSVFCRTQEGWLCAHIPVLASPIKNILVFERTLH